MTLSTRRIAQSLGAVCLAMMFGPGSPESAHAQTPSNALLRVRLIQVGDEYGSSFTIEVDGRQYLSTAKHVVAGLKDRKSMILICKKVGDCSPIDVTVLRCDDPIDIAVLVPSKQLTVSFPLEPRDAGIRFGQDVYFLGFPFGSQFTTKGPSAAYPIPFIKKAILSSEVTGDGATKLFLDGHNNFGFSGGPIVYRDLDQGGYVFNVAGVVSAPRYDAGRFGTAP
jgi:S1-C subfamily serine protease